MMILAKDKLKNPDGGFAKTFLAQMEQVLGTCLGDGIKVVSNAGGLNPAGLRRRRIQAIATRLGLSPHGRLRRGRRPDAPPRRAAAAGIDLANIDTGEKLDELGVVPLTANAYLGGWGIVEAPRRAAPTSSSPGGSPTPPSWSARPRGTSAGPARTGTSSPAPWWPATSSSAAPSAPAATTPSSRRSRPRAPGLPHRRDRTPTARSSSPSTPAPAARSPMGTVTAQLLYEIQGLEYANPDVRSWPSNSHPARRRGPDRVRVHRRPGPARPRTRPRWPSTTSAGTATR